MGCYKTCQCLKVKREWNLSDVEGTFRACRDYDLGCRALELVLASVASVASIASSVELR